MSTSGALGAGASTFSGGGGGASLTTAGGGVCTGGGDSTGGAIGKGGEGCGKLSHNSTSATFSKGGVAFQLNDKSKAANNSKWTPIAQTPACQDTSFS